MLVALLVVASMFVAVCYHAYSTYSEIHIGRKTGVSSFDGVAIAHPAGRGHLAAHRSTGVLLRRYGAMSGGARTACTTAR